MPGAPEVADDPAVAIDRQIAELRRLHQRLESRLQELDSHVALTSDEQVERKRIQKMKLYYKDRILILTKRKEEGRSA